MIDYKIVSEENLINCSMSGEMNTHDFQQYAQRLLSDKSFHLGLNAIIDVHEDTVVSYAKEVEGISQVVAQILNMRTGIFWAFVTKNQTTRAIVNLMLQEVDTNNITIDYFESRDDAKAWISK